MGIGEYENFMPTGISIPGWSGSFVPLKKFFVFLHIGFEVENNMDEQCPR
jgi:hypothetical protein